MPRQPRIEYEGAIYHVMSRGDRRENIVEGDEERKLFVKTLEEACAKTDWQVHAFCLMSNHFHLVVETPNANLVAGMKWFLGTYTIRYNTRRKLNGHLFAGRYKSLLVDERDASYLRMVCDYVHLNPVRAGLIKAGERVESYCWSSYPDYLLPAGKRRNWLRVDRLLGEHGVQRDDLRGRLEFARRMESQRKEPGPAGVKSVRRGWKLGAEDFLAHLLDRMEGNLGENHHARERNETEKGKAERIVMEELKDRGLRGRDLSLLRKGDMAKVEIAQRLRKETTASLKWIANRLEMGTWTNVSNRLYDAKNAK
jgi:putative transposase